jgi:hypothetical protein
VELAKGGIASGGRNLHHLVSHRFSSNVFEAHWEKGEITASIKEWMSAPRGECFCGGLRSGKWESMRVGRVREVFAKRVRLAEGV